jgi:hypothetical protein
MKFYVNDCPDNMRMMDYIKMNSHWNEAVADVPWKYNNLVFDIDIDFEASVRESVEKFGYHGWRLLGKESQYYGGYSLVYNPKHVSGHEPINSTLGEYQYGGDEYLLEVKDGSGVKNSYFDTLGFTERTEPARFGVLGEFLDEIESGFTLIRGRLAILNGQQFDATKHAKFGWHIDEPVYENLRLNIPVWGNTDEYAFQLEGYPVQRLSQGCAYTWDTAILHRAFSTRVAASSRANLVVGISPWLRYDAAGGYWETNEYFGCQHPFSLLIDRRITTKLTLLEQF